MSGQNEARGYTAMKMQFLYIVFSNFLKKILSPLLRKELYSRGCIDLAQNEGIFSTGDSNFQSSGDTTWMEGELNLAAIAEEKYPPGETTPISGLNNKGIVSTGQGNAQISGKTNMKGIKINVGFKGK